MSATQSITLTVAFARGSCRLALEGDGIAPVRFGFTVTAGGAFALAPAAATDGRALLDGPAVAALPVAMRARRALHVAGPISHRALRDLTHYAAAWAAFAPHAFAPVEITAESIVDLAPSPTGDTALLAWDGSLEAAATLARHLRRRVLGAMRPARLVHVGGVGTAQHDRAVAEAIAPVAAAEAIDFAELATDADSAGALDPLCGRLPLTAAGLHLAAGPHRLGLMARRWTYPVLFRRGRTLPQAPDTLSGARLTIVTDGGHAGPTAQAAEAATLPSVAAAIRPRTRHDAELAALGFEAAGLRPPPALGLPSPLIAAVALDLARGANVAAARLIGPRPVRSVALSVLRARLAGHSLGELIGDHARWVGAMLNLRAPWPR